MQKVLSGGIINLWQDHGNYFQVKIPQCHPLQEDQGIGRDHQGGLSTWVHKWHLQWHLGALGMQVLMDRSRVQAGLKRVWTCSGWSNLMKLLKVLWLKCIGWIKFWTTQIQLDMYLPKHFGKRVCSPNYPKLCILLSKKFPQHFSKLQLELVRIHFLPHSTSGVLFVNYICVTSEFFHLGWPCCRLIRLHCMLCMIV